MITSPCEVGRQQILNESTHSQKAEGIQGNAPQMGDYPEKQKTMNMIRAPPTHSRPLRAPSHMRGAKGGGGFMYMQGASNGIE
jgi:hypothetical protein